MSRHTSSSSLEDGRMAAYHSSSTATITTTTNSSYYPGHLPPSRAPNSLHRQSYEQQRQQQQQQQQQQLPHYLLQQHHQQSTPLQHQQQLHHRYNSSLASSSARSSSPASVTRKHSLTPISVPSFSAFRSQLPSATSLKRPSVPQLRQHSPRAASFSISEKASPKLAEPHKRPVSLAGPPRQPSGLANPAYPPVEEEVEIPHQNGSSYHIPHSHHGRNGSIDSRIASTVYSSEESPRHLSIPTHTKYANGGALSHAPGNSDASIVPGSPTRPEPMTAVHSAPTMTLQLDGIQRTLSDDSLGADSLDSHGGPRPKSPVSRLGSFFGWKSPQQKSELDSSPTTTFSDRSLSPMPSPRLVKTLPVQGTIAPARLTPPGLDIQKANQPGNYFDNPETPLLLGHGGTHVHVKELERELSHVSQELAGSIRREMDLEDELERIRAEYPMASHSDLGRRSSDYFSDSGASSTRFPIVDVDAKVEQLERQLRKTEQDKANMKVEMASRIQTELARRRDLEELVRDLEDQLDKRSSDDGGAGGGERERLEELTSSLDETKKRLGQEKQSKESFEDLYSATREELERFRNERDNLRDEVVPQLRARIEGLEASAAENQAQMYETSRLQQELHHSRFNSLADSVEGEDRISALVGPRGSLTRSSSLANKSGPRRGGSVKERADGGRQRSGSLTGHPDAPNDVEEQRNALHQALKLLIRRYERQQRNHERAIKKLSVANALAESHSGARGAAAKPSPYHKEVAFLKDEVTTLRKRTEDVLEQKWQYEKGLSGLKMDLDRAEQETRGLRLLLQDPDAMRRPSVVSSAGEAAAAEEVETPSDEKLKLSIATAEHERDRAHQEAQAYRQRAPHAPGDASAQLLESATRMDELAEQLDKQVQVNVQLRDRLTRIVSQGEREQRESTRRIEEMQKRLAGMEDSVLAAQTHSETSLAAHDAELRRLEDAVAASPRLQRLPLPHAGFASRAAASSSSSPALATLAVPEPGKLSPASPLTRKSPRLGRKLSEVSLLEASRTQTLERKVRELEGLLKEAEDDMQTVVQRVTRSQLEVNELQMERDAALVLTRKLQKESARERELAEALM